MGGEDENRSVLMHVWMEGGKRFFDFLKEQGKREMTTFGEREWLGGMGWLGR